MNPATNFVPTIASALSMAASATVFDDLDIDQFEDQFSADLVLTNPATGTPTKATITIVGPEHPARKKIQFDRARRQRAEFAKKGKLDVRDPLEDLEEQTDFMVACTVGWSGLKAGGTPLPFSGDAARTLYNDPKRQWLRAQVFKGLDEAERFISSSTKA